MVCTKKATQLIAENFSNTKITFPALGVLLALRDKSFDATISAILSTPQLQISKIKALASEYAKDLEQNIESFEKLEYEPTVKVRKVKRKESSPMRAKETIGQEMKTKSKTKCVDDILEEEKKIIKKKSDRNIMIKVIDKESPKKSSSPIVKTKVSDEELLIELMNSEKEYSIEELKQIINIILKLSETTTQKSFWKKMIAKILGFLFNDVIFSSDEDIQMIGLQVLEKVIYYQIELLPPYLNEIMENIAKSYTLPKRAWDTLGSICENLANKFTQESIILLLLEIANDIDPSLIPAFIRCLNCLVKLGGICDSFIENLAKFLFSVINYII